MVGPNGLELEAFCGRSLAGARRRNPERSRGTTGFTGRPGRTRTSDLFRVNFEVNKPNPFPHLAFPQVTNTEKRPIITSFDGN